MEDFIRKVIEGNKITPSGECLKSFNKNFKSAISVEWYDKDSYYEAIFYKHGLEHIAIFSLEGILLEYRQNITSDYLPEPIKKIALSKGEIMNSIFRNKGNLLEYEVIVRDKELLRYLLTFSDIGGLIEERKL